MNKILKKIVSWSLSISMISSSFTTNIITSWAADNINSITVSVTNPSVFDSNTFRVGDTVKAEISSNGEGRVNYQWYRTDYINDELISGATQETYTLQEEDNGKSVYVKITGKDSTDIEGERKSASHKVVNTVGHVTIRNQKGFDSIWGTKSNDSQSTSLVYYDYVGDTVEAVLENKYQEGKVNYQWYRGNYYTEYTYGAKLVSESELSNYTLIEGATSSAYKITGADYGYHLVCKVTAKEGLTLTGTADAYETRYGVHAVLINANIIGNPFVGETLSAKAITATGDTVEISRYGYQWCDFGTSYISGSGISEGLREGYDYTSINGGYGTDYTIKKDDKGKRLGILIQDDYGIVAEADYDGMSELGYLQSDVYVYCALSKNVEIGTCEDIGKEHIFNDWTITKSPTSTENGEMQRKCTVCGKIETKEFSLSDYEVKAVYDSDINTVTATLYINGVEQNGYEVKWYRVGEDTEIDNEVKTSSSYDYNKLTNADKGSKIYAKIEADRLYSNNWITSNEVEIPMNEDDVWRVVSAKLNPETPQVGRTVYIQNIMVKKGEVEKALPGWNYVTYDFYVDDIKIDSLNDHATIPSDAGGKELRVVVTGKGLADDGETYIDSVELKAVVYDASMAKKITKVTLNNGNNLARPGDEMPIVVLPEDATYKLEKYENNKKIGEILNPTEDDLKRLVTEDDIGKQIRYRAIGTGLFYNSNVNSNTVTVISADTRIYNVELLNSNGTSDSVAVDEAATLKVTDDETGAELTLGQDYNVTYWRYLVPNAYGYSEYHTIDNSENTVTQTIDKATYDTMYESNKRLFAYIEGLGNYAGLNKSTGILVVESRVADPKTFTAKVINSKDGSDKVAVGETAKLVVNDSETGVELELGKDFEVVTWRNLLTDISGGPRSFNIDNSANTLVQTLTQEQYDNMHINFKKLFVDVKGLGDYAGTEDTFNILAVEASVADPVFTLSITSNTDPAKPGSVLTAKVLLDEKEVTPDKGGDWSYVWKNENGDVLQEGGKTYTAKTEDVGKKVYCEIAELNNLKSNEIPVVDDTPTEDELVVKDNEKPDTPNPSTTKPGNTLIAEFNTDEAGIEPEQIIYTWYVKGNDGADDEEVGSSKELSVLDELAGKKVYVVLTYPGKDDWMRESSLITVKADTEETSKGECNVIVTQGQSFTVTIPAFVSLNGDKNKANEASFKTVVIADISGSDSITVEPAVKSFEMTERGGIKKALTATITGDKLGWRYAYDEDDCNEAAFESGIERVHKISVAKLSAGKWTGTFNWNITTTGNKIKDSQEYVKYRTYESTDNGLEYVEGSEVKVPDSAEDTPWE